MATRKLYDQKPPKMAYLFGDSFFDTDAKEREKEEKEKAFEAYLRYLADGNTMAYSYRRAGLTRTQIEYKRANNTEFAGLEQRALAEGVECLEQEAKRRAFGIEKDVWYKGEVVGKEVEYSDSLLQFLLKAKDPKFRETRNVVTADINSTVSQGMPAFDTTKFSEDELLQFEELLQKGTVSND
jgi:hypothetical protein